MAILGVLFCLTIAIALPLALVLGIVLSSDSFGEALGCLGVIVLLVVAYFAVMYGLAFLMRG